MSVLAMSGWQAWLFLAAIAAVAIGTFLVRPRPPRLVVPSLLVWTSVLDHSRELSWWDRVRRAVSLLLTALIAVALGLAFLRPGRSGASGPGRRLIVLDSSWSMRARTHDGRTRWQHAIAQVRALARSSGGDEVTLATTAGGVVAGPTTDVALIDAGLDRLVPGGGDEAAWPRVDRGTATFFVTDGAVERSLDPTTRIRSVFESADNVAITAFAVRPATSSETRAEAYLEVTNHAGAQAVHVTVTRGTQSLVDSRFDMATGEVLRQAIPLEADGDPRLATRISASANALDVDDDAVAWLGMAEPMAITVVSDAPEAFQRLLASDPNLHVATQRPSAYAPTQTTDVWIFDRWLPSRAPERPFLAVAPPAPSWLVTAGRDEIAPSWADGLAHPVLQGVDAVTLDILRAHAYAAPALRPLARSARGTPLVSAIDTSATRAVLVGFALGESNLASTPAFPVLIGNALDWLAHPAAGETRTPGPMEFPASTSRVVGPDGAPVPLSRAGDRVLAWLRQPGLYRLEAAGAHSVIGVNVGRAVPDLRQARIESDDARGSQSVDLTSRPWWQYALIVAALGLAIEWWTWQRRVTV